MHDTGSVHARNTRGRHRGSEDALTRTRLPDQVPHAPWAYGTDLGYMRDLIPWWREQFDWRAQKAKLNAFPQFKVPLHGIDLHFIRAEGKGPNPLLLMHGWPGSVFEFMEIIPRRCAGSEKFYV